MGYRRAPHGRGYLQADTRTQSGRDPSGYFPFPPCTLDLLHGIGAEKKKLNFFRHMGTTRHRPGCWPAQKTVPGADDPGSTEIVPFRTSLIFLEPGRNHIDRKAERARCAILGCCGHTAVWQTRTPDGVAIQCARGGAPAGPAFYSTNDGSIHMELRFPKM